MSLTTTIDRTSTGAEESARLRPRIHELIPGGCQTYDKGDHQFPVNAPGFIVRGKGSHVWDADGNEYIEYGMGCCPVTLGHGFPSVVEAVRDALPHGTNFSRPSPIELECAEELTGSSSAARPSLFIESTTEPFDWPFHRCSRRFGIPQNE